MLSTNSILNINALALILLNGFNEKNCQSSQMAIILPFSRLCPKVNQEIYTSPQTSIPNIKARAQIGFEIYC